MSIQYYDPPNGCVYCGSSAVLPPNYDRAGTGLECMKKGFGGGMHSERRKWQQRLGLPIDPEVKALCGDEKDIRNKLKNYKGSNIQQALKNYNDNDNSNSSSSNGGYSSSSKNEVSDNSSKKVLDLAEIPELPPPLSFDYPVFSLSSSSSPKKRKNSRSRSVKRIASSKNKSKSRERSKIKRYPPPIKRNNNSEVYYLSDTFYNMNT